jgi:hypothetical protein
MDNKKKDQKPRDIVLAFAELLQREDYEPSGSVPSALPQSLLPFPKDVIRHAIALLLLSEKDRDRRKVLEEAYLYLDRFISDDEYELFYSFDKSFRESSTPDDLVKKAQLIPQSVGMSQRVNATIKVMIERKEQAMEEIRALRRIMGLSDDLSDLIEE